MSRKKRNKNKPKEDVVNNEEVKSEEVEPENIDANNVAVTQDDLDGDAGLDADGNVIADEPVETEEPTETPTEEVKSDEPVEVPTEEVVEEEPVEEPVEVPTEEVVEEEPEEVVTPEVSGEPVKEEAPTEEVVEEVPNDGEEAKPEIIEEVEPEVLDDEKINEKQADIVENYERPEGGVEKDGDIPEIYALSNSKLATEVVNKVKEFKELTDTRPFVSIDKKVVAKYQLSILVKDLFQRHEDAKIAIINLASEEELLNYIVALGQLTNQTRWPYAQDLLSRVDIFLNLISIYDYKLRGVDSTDTRPNKEMFKSYLFKSGATKAVASTLSELLY